MKAPSSVVQYVLWKYEDIPGIGGEGLCNTFYHTGTALFRFIDELYLSGLEKEQIAMELAKIVHKSRE